jgi:hypothetical protein
MPRKDKIVVAAVALFTAIVSLVIANSLFNSPAKHDSTGPVVEQVQGSLPDVKNDPDYNTFLNNRALDPTQLVQIGNSQNNNPF